MILWYVCRRSQSTNYIFVASHRSRNSLFYVNSRRRISSAGRKEMVTKSSGPALEKRIGCIKFTIFCLNAVIWIVGCAMFGLSIWMRFEPMFEEWVEFLNMYEFYIGIYLLIATSVLVMAIAFIGCAAALMEHITILYVHVGLQAFSFICCLTGAAVILDYSTYDSKIQPIIERSMYSLISNSHLETASFILRVIQETVGCCGADGPRDYTQMRKPLPTECRDTVTGNAFHHGCVEELSWFLEARSGWLAGMAMALCMLHVIIAVLSLTLVRAIKKEEESISPYVKR